MQPTSAPLKTEAKLNGMLAGDDDPSQEMMDPILSKYRYGREDLLALMGKEASIPEGLRDCPFFVEKAQDPIILGPLSETELRLQQNINSSKALSALNRQDRFNMINGTDNQHSSGSGGGNNPPSASSITSTTTNRWGAVGNGSNTNKWTIAGGNRNSGSGTGSTHKGSAPTSNRWSGLGTSVNSGPSGGGTNEGNAYRNFRTSAATAPPTDTTSNRTGFGRAAGFGRSHPASATNLSSDQRATGAPPRYRAPGNSADVPQSPVGGALPPQQDYGLSANKSPPLVRQQQSAQHSPPSTSEIKNDSYLSQISNIFPGAPKDADPAPTKLSASSPSKPDEFVVEDFIQQRILSEASHFKSAENSSSVPSAQAAAAVQPPSQNSGGPPRNNSNSVPLDEKWNYIDPSGIPRGPFLATQLHVWYKSGYFNSSLALYREGEQNTITLGELINLNGAANPFIFKMPLEADLNRGSLAMKVSNSSPQNTAESLQTSPKPTDSSKIWTNIGANPIMRGLSQSIGATGGFEFKDNDLDIQKILEVKERMLAEEQQKLFEKEEKLRLEEQERLERERLIIEKENDLKRRAAEIERKTLEAQKELENKRIQMANLEMQRLEEMERLQQKFRQEQLQQARLKEEEELRRAQELRAKMLQEQERQRQFAEAEAQRKRDEEEKKIRIAYEEARRLQEMALQATNRAQEEQRQHMLEEAQLRQAEELKLKNEQQRQKQEASAHFQAQTEQQQLQEILRRQQLEAELNAIAIEKILRENMPPVVEKKTTPWVKVGEKKAPPKTKDNNKIVAKTDEKQKSLLEIQQEEEKALKESKQTETNAWLNAAAAKTSLAPSQKLPWGSPAQPIIVPSAVAPPPATVNNNAKPVAVRSWNPIPATQPAPIPKEPSKVQPKAQKSNNNQKKNNVKVSTDKPKPPDAFTLWIIKRVRELNSQIDAEVFVGFIEGIDSPNEAEDYIIGYLGSSKEVKDFYREFLLKRIELRPRLNPIQKDDLSGPAAAVPSDILTASATTGNSGNSDANNSNSTGSASSAKKKKKTKSQQKIDPASLGFRPSGDPNRINVGEIDNAPPVPVRKR